MQRAAQRADGGNHGGVHIRARGRRHLADTTTNSFAECSAFSFGRAEHSFSKAGHRFVLNTDAVRFTAGEPSLMSATLVAHS